MWLALIIPLNSLEFVNRRRELAELKREYSEASKGNARIFVIEGPAGIGKTTLIDRFLKSTGASFLRARGRIENRSTPYSLVKESLKEYGSIRRIEEEHQRMKLKKLADTLVENPKMVFIDENRGGASLELFKILSSRKKLALLSPRRFGEGIWITGLKGDKNVKPRPLEFYLLPKIIDLFKAGFEGVVVENLNYLVYMNGIEAVADFIRALKSYTSNRIVVFSGWMEHLTEDERGIISSLFEEMHSFDIGMNLDEKSLILSDEDGFPEGVWVFSDISKISPDRLYFDIFDSIINALDSGRDVGIDFLPVLIKHHGIRRIYVWLKDVVDHATIRGRRVYVNVKHLMGLHLNILSTMADEHPRMDLPAEQTLQSNTLRFYDAVLWMLRERSLDNPFVVVFEDIHWADRGSIDLILYLIRNLSNEKLLLIISYRSEVLINEPEVLDAISEMKKCGRCRFIRLKPLGIKEIGEILKQINGDISDENIEIIYEKSGGNPLLAISIAKNFSGDSEGIPETIWESVMAMVDAMDDSALHLLWSVAVAGESAPKDLLDSLTPHWRKSLELCREILYEDDGYVSFKYSSHREVIYESMPHDVRRKLHERIGRYYLERGDIPEAARHLYLARSKESVDLLIKSVDMLVKDLAIKNALEYAEMALKIARKYGVDTRPIAERLGDLYRLNGDYQKAIDTYRKLMSGEDIHLAIKIAESLVLLARYDEALEILNKYLQIARGIDRGRIAGNIGHIMWKQGKFEEAKMYLGEYLKYARKYQSLRDMAEAYRNMAIVYYYLSDYEKAIEYAKNAIDYSKESGDYDILANSYNVLGVIYSDINEMDRALEYIKRYMSIAEKIGNYSYISMGYHNLAAIYADIGKVREAMKYYKISLEYDLKIGNKWDIAITYYNLGTLEMEFGNANRAREYYEKSIKLTEEIGDKHMSSSGYIDLGNLYRMFMDYEMARELIMKGIELAKDIAYIIYIIMGYLALYDLYVEQGMLEEAERYLKKAEGHLSNIEEIKTQLDVMFKKVDFLLRKGKINESEDLLEEIYRILRENGNKRRETTAHLMRARIRCARGDRSNAIIYFEKAIENVEFLGDMSYKAEILSYYGECLRSLKDDEWRKYMQEAIDIYRNLGFEARARALEEKMGQKF